MVWYSTGNVTTDNNSPTVTGNGTSFLANISIGDGIVFQGHNAIYEITNIASNTQITVSPNVSATLSGVAYRVIPILGYDKMLSDAFNTLRLSWGNTLAAIKNWAIAANADEARNNLGLGNINNTSDTNKPISTATQNALNSKLNASNPVVNGGLEIRNNNSSDGDGFAWSNNIASWNIDAINDASRIFATRAGTTIVPFQLSYFSLSPHQVTLQLPNTYNFATGAAPNLVINSSGILQRSTSSAKYKKDIEPLSEDYSAKIFDFEPIWYRSLGISDNPEWSYYGFTAEQIAKVEPRLVQWKTHETVTEFRNVISKQINKEGEEVEITVRKPCIKSIPLDKPVPDGVAYDRLTPLIVHQLKIQKKRIDILEASLQSALKRISTL